MKKHYYFIVEGVHDTAAIGRFLKQFNLSRIQRIEKLDPFWERTIPKSFPHEGDLLKRVPVPMYFQNDVISVAIQTAGSDSLIAATFNGLVNIDYDELSGIAVFCDADEKVAEERFEQVYQSLLKSSEYEMKVFIENVQFNRIKHHPTKFGIFVFPNNEDSGTLEQLLLEGGEAAYPDLLHSAKKYVDEVSAIYKRKWTQSSEVKVLFGVAANILKPGKANQVSIQDNDWIGTKTIEQTNQIKLKKFLSDILQ
ncbi:hypothetical protein PGH26_03610 [Sporosarcina jeotgali]|uniref:Uncharacterized protein n=1 Tax=Sporosarcina jeotgali TaxID=3020056 RepID=A0ABZ0KXA0_9BACL|nr:DUF3226 domain-containing protein [Sporosarcina sp. B2O-1]WOV85027.1 hypothetical protein PGH26_03610 [Sporosarcina sp. B2O-1]